MKSRKALLFTQSPTQWVPEVVSLVCSGRAWSWPPHIHPVTRLRMLDWYLHFPIHLKTIALLVCLLTVPPELIQTLRGFLSGQYHNQWFCKRKNILTVVFCLWDVNNTCVSSYIEPSKLWSWNMLTRQSTKTFYSILFHFYSSNLLPSNWGEEKYI